MLVVYINILIVHVIIGKKFHNMPISKCDDKIAYILDTYNTIVDTTFMLKLTKKI